MDLDYLRTEYESEWQRRDQLQSAAGTPIAGLTLLGSALVYLVQKFESDSVTLRVAFWIFVALSAAAYVVSAYMVIRSYVGYTYRRIPLPSQLDRYETELRLFLSSQRVVEQNDVRDDFESHLREAYIDAVDRNAVNNTNRGAYLHKANSAFVLALVAAAFASIPTAIVARNAPDKPQPVFITNTTGTPMTDPKTPATKPTEPAPAPTQRPQFPQNLDVKTGTKKPETK